MSTTEWTKSTALWIIAPSLFTCYLAITHTPAPNCLLVFQDIFLLIFVSLHSLSQVTALPLATEKYGTLVWTEEYSIDEVTELIQ